MSNWHVNEGLEPLLDQVRAAYPGIVIGTIGDQQHESEGDDSDHNPNAAHRVNAADFMLGPYFTEQEAGALVAALLVDPRTKYVIWERHIWRSPTGHSAALAGWHTYTGLDPHTGHVHESVWDSAHTDTRHWDLGDAMTPDELLSNDSVPNLYRDQKTNPNVTVRTALKAAVSADVKLNSTNAMLSQILTELKKLNGS